MKYLKKKDAWLFWYAMSFFVAVGFDRFYYNFVFAIKPFVVVAAFGIIISVFVIKTMTPLLDLEKWMLIFMLIYLIACIRSYNISYGFRYICGILVIIGFYFSIRIVLAKISIKQMEKIISISGIIIAISSLVSYIWGLYLVQFDFENIVRMRSGGILIEHGIPRLFSTMNNDPNISALMFLMYALFFMYHLSSVQNCIGFTLSGICILLTFSRSVLLALFVAWLLGRVLPCYERKPIRFRKVYVFFPILLVLSLIFFRYCGIDWWGLLVSRLRSLTTDNGTGRFLLWEIGIEGWTTNPLWGIGGNYTKTYVMQSWGKEQVLHNSWLEIFVETGVIGMLPCLMFLGKAYQSCQKVVIQYKNRFVMVLFIAMFIMMNSVSTQFNEGFWLVVAVIYRYSLGEKEELRSGTGDIY